MAEGQMTKYKIVAIGGSAGSLDVILKIISAAALPVSLAYVIIIHRKNDPSSILTELLASRSPLAVKEVEDKESITTGTIYIAPPDYHLLVEDYYSFSLDSSEKVHHSRPSIDVSFESIASVFGPTAIGILLSGANADGAEGLKKIRLAGGYTIAQDPKDAEVAYMPQQAILADAQILIAGSDQLAGEIIRIVNS
ncbi:chemotaxis protein CheB [Pollutibacter soli]|uniref:chemotaxis protein CheB n=1 Tax=Pollutibacter soli TaxID=3034157 RepID=UPI0030132988